jgi:ferredoxin
MGQLYSTSTSDWQEFIIELLPNWNIFAPIKEQDTLSYDIITKDNINLIELYTHRTTQPLKTFLSFFYEQITNITKFPNLRTFAVMGLKACDLNSLQLLDKVFLEGEFIEPFYKRSRQDLLLISSDCQQPLEACFCSLLEGKPYPEEYFDINLSLMNVGLILEVNSKKGEDFIKIKKDIFKKVVDRNILIKREARRRAITEKIQQLNNKWGIKPPFLDLVRNGLRSVVWERSSKTCVACGACTNICPNCYCFIIEELNAKKDNAFVKCRYWDSCQYAGFSKGENMPNPRKNVYERLRYRFLHKFDYLRENFGFDGCTGCGRCIDACLGKIDMRQILSELKNNA